MHKKVQNIFSFHSIIIDPFPLFMKNNQSQAVHPIQVLAAINRIEEKKILSSSLSLTLKVKIKHTRSLMVYYAWKKMIFHCPFS